MVNANHIGSASYMVKIKNALTAKHDVNNKKNAVATGLLLISIFPKVSINATNIVRKITSNIAITPFKTIILSFPPR